MLNIENIHLDYNLYYWIIKMLHQTRIYILYNGNFDGETQQRDGCFRRSLYITKCFKILFIFLINESMIKVSGRS